MAEKDKSGDEGFPDATLRLVARKVFLKTSSSHASQVQDLMAVRRLSASAVRRNRGIVEERRRGSKESQEARADVVMSEARRKSRREQWADEGDFMEGRSSFLWGWWRFGEREEEQFDSRAVML
jgi:hypothetical protein